MIYKPKNCSTVTLLAAGKIFGMLELKIQAPRNINSHTEKANTKTNISTCPVDAWVRSSALTLAKGALPLLGVMAATILEIVDTNDVAIFGRNLKIG